MKELRQTASPGLQDSILNNFARITGIKSIPVPPVLTDGTLKKIRLRMADNFVDVTACLMDNINYPDLSQLMVQRDRHGKLLVLAKMIMPKFRKELQRIAINYIDSAGNAFIRLDGLYVSIDGLKEAFGSELVIKPFSRSLIKVIYQLLQREHLVNRSLKEFRVSAAVSSTPVRQALDLLKGLGYFLPAGKRSYSWQRKKELTGKWTKDYLEVLRPTLLLGNFSFKEESKRNNWKLADLSGTSAQWSGLPAAELLSGKKMPVTRYIVYTSGDTNELMERLHLVPDDSGPVSIYKSFWNNWDIEDRTVHPLLVFADLTAEPAAPGIGSEEAARWIREQYLENEETVHKAPVTG